MEDPRLTHIEFIAQLMNEQEAKLLGYAAATRWLTLREDLRNNLRQRAIQMYEDWKADELRAEKNRQVNDI